MDNLASGDTLNGKVRIRVQDEVVIISFLEDLVSESIDEFSTLLNSIIRQGKYKIILDFSQIVYMCSFALGIMIHTLKKVRERGGDLKISGLSEWLRSLIKVARIDEIVKIYNSAEEALESFK